MKPRFFGIIALFLGLFCQRVGAQPPHNFGLGFIVGDPTGISAKLFTSPENAMDFAFGWWNSGNRLVRHGDYYYGNTSTHFHADYLWHAWNAIRSTERFPLYYGVGGSVETAEGYNSVFAFRGVFGIAWMPRRAPLDIYLELVPSLQLNYSSGFYFDGAFGARFYF